MLTACASSGANHFANRGANRAQLFVQPAELIAVAGGFFEFFLSAPGSNVSGPSFAFLPESLAFILSFPVDGLFWLSRDPMDELGSMLMTEDAVDDDGDSENDGNL